MSAGLPPPPSKTLIHSVSYSWTVFFLFFLFSLSFIHTQALWILPSHALFQFSLFLSWSLRFLLLLISQTLSHAGVAAMLWGLLGLPAAFLHLCEAHYNPACERSTIRSLLMCFQITRVRSCLGLQDEAFCRGDCFPAFPVFFFFWQLFWGFMPSLCCGEKKEGTCCSGCMAASCATFASVDVSTMKGTDSYCNLNIGT